MTLSCVIIEDEPPAIAKLRDFISRVPFLSLNGCFENALDGLHCLNTNPVNLLFLDIQMETLTGIQLLETLVQKPYVILTTAYSEYALKGFELHVFDYLLKPYSFDRFLNAVNTVYDDVLRKRYTAEVKTHFFVKTEYRLENVAFDKILWIEGMREYLQIVLLDKKIMTKQSFKCMMDQLPEDRFVQVHKSWVVSLAKIDSIERNRIRIGKEMIPIGDVYRDPFYARLSFGKK